MKVQIFVCGEGLGHTSRSLAAGERLIKEGHEVVFCAYGYSKKHLEDNGYCVKKIPSEIKLVGSAGSLNMRRSIGETIKRTDPMAFPNVHRMVKKEAADAVISDSYFMGAIAAKMNKTPTLFMVNQTDQSSYFQDEGAALKTVGRAVKAFQNIISQYVDNILIPDYPPPYTICEKSIPLGRKLTEKMLFTGPLVRKSYDEVDAARLSKPHVLSFIGGFGYREKLLDNVIAAAEMMGDHCFTLVAGPNADAEKYRNKVGENVHVVGNLSDTLQHIKAADVIIAPGGHSTIMEALSFGKPILSFPDMAHPEQEKNADKLHDLGVGMRLSYFTPPRTIAECITEAHALKENCEKMRRRSEELDGTKKIVELVEEKAKK